MWGPYGRLLWNEDTPFPLQCPEPASSWLHVASPSYGSGSAAPDCHRWCTGTETGVEMCNPYHNTQFMHALFANPEFWMLLAEMIIIEKYHITHRLYNTSITIRILHISIATDYKWHRDISTPLQCNNYLVSNNRDFGIATWCTHFQQYSHKCINVSELLNLEDSYCRDCVSGHTFV